MDKQSPEVRKYIAQRAELLGAIRLPNNAFKANAGTEVVSDIIFLQKRDRPIEIEPDWVYLGQNEDGFANNSYFVEHPEMILGRQSVKRRFAIRIGDGLKSPEIRMAATLLQPRDARMPAGATLCRCLAWCLEILPDMRQGHDVKP